MAPELLDNAVENAYTYYAGDIWSVGVVIYTLLIGE
jgi:serine/threonine protein kinase